RVMPFARSVEADLHRRQLTYGIELPRDENPVGVHRDRNVTLREPCDDLLDVRMRQWLPTVEADRPHPEGAELFEDREYLLARQLVRRRGVPIAVAAGEVAEPGQFPGHAERVCPEPQPGDGSPGDDTGVHKASPYHRSRRQTRTLPGGSLPGLSQSRAASPVRRVDPGKAQRARSAAARGAESGPPHGTGSAM